MGSFGIVHWIIFGAIAFFLWRFFGRIFKGQAPTPIDRPALDDRAERQRTPPGMAAVEDGGPGPLLAGDRSFGIAVAGCEYHRDEIAKAFRAKQRAALKELDGDEVEEGDTETIEVVVSLILDDENPHDHQAVRVEYKKTTIGFLPRGLAPLLRKLLAAKHPTTRRCRCKAEVEVPLQLEGGEYAISLDLPRLKS